MIDIVAKLPQGVQGEVYSKKLIRREVKFTDSQLDSMLESEQCRTALRVIKNGRLGKAVSSKPGSEEALLTEAMASVDFGIPVAFDFPGPGVLSGMSSADGSSAAMGLDQMLTIAEELQQAVSDYDARIAVEAIVRCSEAEVSLVNSAGFSGSYRKTVWEASLGGQLIDGDDFLCVTVPLSGQTAQLDYEGLKREVIQQFAWSKQIVPFASGSYPVIFAPSQLVFLTTPFLACLNGKALVSGISPWKDKLGEKMLDSRVTLTDDATLYQAAGGKAFDRDGIPTRRNILIEQGIVKQFLLDCQTARQLERDSTGNSSDEGPAPHHVLLAPGAVSVWDMVKDIDTGLLILDSMGAWSGNPYSGNVSGNISLGLKIENGKIAGRVKNCMFSVNVFEQFRDHLRAFSRETQDVGARAFLDSSSGTYPYAFVDHVGIVAE